MNQPSCVVGIDLVRVSEIQASVERFGDRFLRRIFTPQEIQYCAAQTRTTAERLAARFAAKEATLKVLRPNDERVDWRMIEVERSPAGWCQVVLRETAERLARSRGITALSLSMSHEGDYATAVVVAEIDQASRAGDGDQPARSSAGGAK